MAGGDGRLGEGGNPTLGARDDDALARFLAPGVDPEHRVHHVTALVVAHEGAPWLPRTLHALAGQERPADRVIAVDCGSSDDSEMLLRAVLGEVISIDAEAGLAGALASGAARAVPDEVGVDGPADPWQARWFWIIHDDSAPDPDCLLQLLRGAERNPGAAILVPKTVAWSDPSRLVGIGHRWTPGTPLVNRLEPHERDQGQYDVDRPVYAGNSAGMLVSADVWQALGGMAQVVGDWAGPADLCRRAWGCGGEVVFIPQAVLAHRQAGRRAVRRGAERRPSPRRAERHGQLLLELSQAPTLALPWRWVREVLLTAVRALGLLVTREPEEATAELAGAWDALAHPRRISRARAALRQPPVTSTARPPHVRARRGAALSRTLDAWAEGLRGAGRIPLRRVPRRIWAPLAIAGVLAAASLARHPAALIGSGDLRGGGLLPAPGALDLMRGYLSSWQEARLGAATLLPADLPLLAAASVPLFGSVDMLLRLLVGLALPLAFLSAYASLGPRLPPRQRVVVALAWAVLPAAVAAVGDGRISTLAVLLLGPPAARATYEALAAARHPGAGARRAITAGTLLGVLGAFAPLTLLLVLGGGLVAWLAVGLPRWPVRTGIAVVAVAAVFPALWAVRLLEAPGLLLAELGRNDPGLAEPGPWVWGLSPGGPSALPWSGTPLVVVAVIAAALRGRGRRTAAGLVAGLTLAAAAAWWSAVDWAGAAGAWPGQPLLIAGGLLAVVAAHAAAGPGRVAVVLTWGWRGSVAVLVAGWWVAPSQVTVSSEQAVPAVVALDADSTDRPRALVLSPRGDGGAVGYAVGTAAWLHDADAIAAPITDPLLQDDVEALVSGAGLDVEPALGGRGIRYVVLDGPPGGPLAAALDASAGLRRLASLPEQSLWLVAGQPARAVLAPSEDQGRVTVPVLTQPTEIDVVLHPQMPLPRLLTLAERADPGWSAELAGQPLALDADESGMLSADVDATGSLAIRHDGDWTLVAGAHLAAMAVLAVLALPKRRTIDPDGEVR